MITAKQAKELYDQSGQEVQDFLTYKVDAKVSEAATAGKRTVYIHEGSIEEYRNLETKPFNLAVMEELKKLGYVVSYGKDMDRPYIPAGRRDDNGEGPVHVNYGYRIGW